MPVVSIFLVRRGTCLMAASFSSEGFLCPHIGTRTPQITLLGHCFCGSQSPPFSEKGGPRPACDRQPNHSGQLLHSFLALKWIPCYFPPHFLVERFTGNWLVYLFKFVFIFYISVLLSPITDYPELSGDQTWPASMGSHWDHPAKCSHVFAVANLTNSALCTWNTDHLACWLTLTTNNFSGPLK